MMLMSPQHAAAAANRLTTGQVSPTSGTVQTTFSFSVHYTAGDNPPTAPISVVANVGSTVVALSLSAGSAEDGTYSGSSLLPAGNHTVTFVANAAAQNDPTLTLPGQVAVTPTPTPTPVPGPGNPDGGVNFGTLLLVIAGAGLVTVGLLAMLLGAVRRGGSRAPPGPTPASTTPPTAARPSAFWEASNRLEDEPIGTVEDESQEPPPEPAAEQEVPEADEPIDEPSVPDDDPQAWQGVPPWDEER